MAPEQASAGPRAGVRGRSEARERLLATASGLFYGEGIRAVGVERILAEAAVTRATFYRHFPSKEELVLAYLRGVDGQTRAGVQSAVDATSSAGEALREIGSALADALARPEFRGCAFLKAAAEFSDPEDPVRKLVLEHRAWYFETLAELFTQAFGDLAGRPQPRHAARHFLMMRDGAMSGAHLDGAAELGAALERGVNGLLTVIH
ncbi:MAG TPA: helix-turn-helix domain-containing protein [Pseudonocardia sp.]|nr:helix-turn-helix domain-containing protein [Pseudonocardia sp.]